MRAMKDADLVAKQLGRIAEEELHDLSLAPKDAWHIQHLASKILSIPGFESFMAAIILSNTIVMIIEIDKSVDEESFITSMHWTEGVGWVILILFVLELALRLIASPCAFWKDAWNIGDFIIVVTDLSLSLIGLFAGEDFPVSALRVFRLAKMGRVSKLLRVFPELRMLLLGLAHSCRAVFWGTLMLALFLLIWSMVAVVLIHPLNKNIDHGGCDRCARAYSSVWQALLTFFQQIVAGDSWGQVTIPLIEAYPITILVFIPAFLSIGLSCLNLILAVVVTASQSAYSQEMDDEEAKEAARKFQKESNIIGI